MQTPNELLPDGLQMDLLWTNASPTSRFVGQEVNLPNLSQYKEKRIVYKIWRNNDKYAYIEQAITEMNVEYATATKSGDESFGIDANVFFRKAKCTDNGITFGDCCYTKTESWVTTNDGLIPYKIYGVR